MLLWVMKLWFDYSTFFLWFYIHCIIHNRYSLSIMKDFIVLQYLIMKYACPQTLSGYTVSVNSDPSPLHTTPNTTTTTTPRTPQWQHATTTTNHHNHKHHHHTHHPYHAINPQHSPHRHHINITTIHITTTMPLPHNTHHTDTT